MYIERFPKSLLDDITSNKCIPFIGAGFSRNASCVGNVKIPDWNGLGNKISEYLVESDCNNPIEALSQYEAQYSRANLIELMAKELHINEIYPGKTHLCFCRLYFDIVCTTNFDFLLEDAYSEIYSNQGKPFHVISNENRLSTFLNERTTILKLHGDFNNPADMVITENDFDTYITRNPLFSTYIANLLITRTPLLIGYSLNDPDLRMIWAIIGSRLGSLKRTGYAVLCSATESDVARFKRRGITVINLGAKKGNFSNALTELFSELLDYWDKQTGKSMETSNEEAISKIKYDELTTSELCYFSVPYSKLSLYKKYVFPIVEKEGLVPVAADDFVLPGENIGAKINALIQKAALVVVDLSEGKSTITMELGIIQERKKNCILIASMNSLIPQELWTMPIIRREINANVDDFIYEFESVLLASVKELRKDSNQIYNEPKRLFDLKEYNAAVISAIKLLEITLTKHWVVKEKQAGSSGAIIPLAQMIRIMGDEYEDLDVLQIREWSKIRNQVVHSEYAVSRSQCKKIVEGVYNVIDQLKV